MNCGFSRSGVRSEDNRGYLGNLAATATQV